MNNFTLHSDKILHSFPEFGTLKNFLWNKHHYILSFWNKKQQCNCFVLHNTFFWRNLNFQNLFFSLPSFGQLWLLFASLISHTTTLSHAKMVTEGGGGLNHASADCFDIKYRFRYSAYLMRTGFALLIPLRILSEI